MNKQLDISEVHAEVCRYFNVDYFHPFVRSTKKDYVYVRQIFHYITRKMTNKKMVTFEKIGNYLSDISEPFSHSNVINSCNKIEGYLIYDKQVQKDVNDIMDNLLNQ